jgi:hypothetical protein
MNIKARALKAGDRIGLAAPSKFINRFLRKYVYA